MRAKIKRAILSASVFLIAIIGLAPGLSMAALNCTRTDLTTQQAIQCGTNGAGGNTQDAAQATNNVNDTVSSVINVLSAFVGVLAVIMIIIGGFRYITSGGKQESVTGAKNTILYAIVGLVIVALAQLIVHFVLNNTNTVTNTAGNSNASNPPAGSCVGGHFVGGPNDGRPC